MVLLYLWTTGSVIVSMSWAESKAQFQRWESDCRSPEELFSHEQGSPAPLHLCGGKYGYRSGWLFVVSVISLGHGPVGTDIPSLNTCERGWLPRACLPLGCDESDCCHKLHWEAGVCLDLAGEGVFKHTEMCSSSILSVCSSWSLNVKHEWINR